MSLYQLTVVRPLLPPLEVGVSKPTEGPQRDEEHTSRDEVRHNVRGLDDGKDQLRYLPQSADRIEICFSERSYAARVGIMRDYRTWPGLTRVCSAIHRWRTPVKMPMA